MRNLIHWEGENVVNHSITWIFFLNIKLFNSMKGMIQHSHWVRGYCCIWAYLSSKCKHGKVDQKMLRYTKIIVLVVKGLKEVAKCGWNWNSHYGDLYCCAKCSNVRYQVEIFSRGGHTPLRFITTCDKNLLPCFICHR